jgi:predicted nucleic acid-binding protein
LRPSIDIVVADAGPLIALARLEMLPLLPALFSRAWVTETVLAECLAGTDRSEGAVIRAAVVAGHLTVRPVSAALPAWSIDAGEASAIAAALELGAGVVMDDRAGRRLASRLGVPVIGALGVLVLAKRAGLIAEIRPLAESLVDSGYYLAGSVIENALRLAGELPPEAPSP